MILLILLALLLVATAVAGLLGVGLLSEGRRKERTGVLALLGAPVILVGGIAVLGLVVVGIGGGGGGGETDGADADRDGRPTTTVAQRSAPTAPAPAGAPGGNVLAESRIDQPAVTMTIVAMRPADDDRFAPYSPVSGLAPGGVVRVQAAGFGSERGHIAQCVMELGRRTACAEPFPVQFDDRGTSDFQMVVRGEISRGGCRLGQATCLLRLTGDMSHRTATVQTILVDRLVPGTVRVEPAHGVADGQAVDLAVTGFPPGTRATAVLCAPPAPYDAERCTAPDPASTFTVDGGGAGRTAMVVRAGRLGPASARCGPRRPCGVAVVVDTGFVTAPASGVAFALGPGVDYEPGRMLAGVLCALVLAAVAGTILVRTDWTKPGEAATPALDGADLRSGQSLDDLFGTEDELDARDPVPW